MIFANSEISLCLAKISSPNFRYLCENFAMAAKFFLLLLLPIFSIQASKSVHKLQKLMQEKLRKITESKN